MPKRSSNKNNTDFNQVAFDIVQKVTERKPPTATKVKKNPAAVALGRLGGKKGGPARALALSKAERSQIASKAAKARWKKKV